MNNFANAGGFNPLLSPPASVASEKPRILPQPRQTPLKAGSKKAETTFNYLDTHTDRIDTRVAGRSADGGYNNFGQVANDLDSLIDLLWVSSTRRSVAVLVWPEADWGAASLQVPFLLTIGSRITDYLERFSFAPRRTFALLNKLDLIFASILTGVDAETGVELLNIQQRPLSNTEKARLQSIVDTTRVAVVHVLGKATASMRESLDNTADEATTNTETESEAETDGDYGDGMKGFFREDASDDDDDWEMDMARVYERTVGLLADMDARLAPTYDKMET